MNYKTFLAIAAAGIIPIGIFMILPYGFWADIDELPMHPLIVHGVIVALPIAAIWILLSVWKTDIFRKSWKFLYPLTIVATLGVIAAKSSGDSLSAAVGLPDEHAEAGNRLLPVAIAMSGSVLLMMFFTMVRPIKIFGTSTRVLASFATVVALPLTYLAGHSGAEAVWEKEYAEAQKPISTESLEFTMDEVQRRDDASACWSVVDGVIYDLTTFIERHPAGSGAILDDMCGKDATEDFQGEHGGQGEPEKWLETLRIGVLVD
ncbi:MAG: hypothetical protein RLZ37_1693 [Actinomycetota bacterium]